MKELLTILCLFFFLAKLRVEKLLTRAMHKRECGTHDTSNIRLQKMISKIDRSVPRAFLPNTAGNGQIIINVLREHVARAKRLFPSAPLAAFTNSLPRVNVGTCEFTTI